MNTTARIVWFGCSSTPRPIFEKSVQTPTTKPESLKLHASLHDFPLASKIMVRNLACSTTESCLRVEFSPYGELAEVKLVVDEATKRSKGYAFIQYTCQDDAILALESMDHKYLDGRLVFVELAKPGRNASCGYPKTCGPPPQEKISVLSKSKIKEISVLGNSKKKEKISAPNQDEEAME